MSKRKRLTGRERREQRRQAREGPRWMRWDVLLTAAGVATALVVALVLTQFVFGGGDGDNELALAPSPTPAQDTEPVPAADEGPPEISGEPTFTDSGLGIIEIEAGAEEAPQAGQTLVVHYTGWLADGTKFDSSVDRGTPFEFVLGAGEVIGGWDEGLALMSAGEKARLIIPPELGYGEAGSPPGIPPNAELTFDVELVEIKDAP
jgi:peptidylprolyl isomerase